MPKKLILASASPRRRELLSRIVSDFDIVVSDASETGGGLSSGCALYNAELKAENVAQRNPDSLVIGADTVIEFENEIIGKPRNADDALRILLRLSGRIHHVTTGVCLRCESEKIRIRFAEITEVEFLPFGENVARAYLGKVPVLDKAGAYALQDCGEMIVREVRGDRDNVIGLPVARLRESLIVAGVRVLQELIP